MIDSVTQQSYILKNTADDLGLENIEMKILIHFLFVSCHERNRSFFIVKLGAPCGKLSCNIAEIYQPAIWSKILRFR